MRLGPGHNVAAPHRDHDDWIVEFYSRARPDEERRAPGYFDPRPWHHDRPQQPKVWDADKVALHVGPAADARLHAQPGLTPRRRHVIIRRNGTAWMGSCAMDGDYVKAGVVEAPVQRSHLGARGLRRSASPVSAPAQSYPARPIHLVTGNPPGGATDFIARIIGQPLGVRLGQGIVIDNRPGANGNISAEVVAKAAAGRLHAALRQRQPRGRRSAHLQQDERQADG